MTPRRRLLPPKLSTRPLVRIDMLAGISAIAAALLITCAAHAEKPNSGPVPVEPAPVQRPADAPTPAETRASKQVDARDAADLLRARYESTHKPGPVPPDAADQFDKIIDAFRTAIDIEPRGPVATYCRHRLAGAYTYVQDFDAAQRVLAEAVNVASGPIDQVTACHAAGLHTLQAQHKPAVALEWFKRAQTTLDRTEFDNPDLLAKWRTAISESIARCETELARK